MVSNILDTQTFRIITSNLLFVHRRYTYNMAAWFCAVALLRLVYCCTNIR